MLLSKKNEQLGACVCKCVCANNNKLPFVILSVGIRTNVRNYHKLVDVDNNNNIYQSSIMTKNNQFL